MWAGGGSGGNSMLWWDRRRDSSAQVAGMQSGVSLSTGNMFTEHVQTQACAQSRRKVKKGTAGEEHTHGSEKGKEGK